MEGNSSNSSRRSFTPIDHRMFPSPAIENFLNYFNDNMQPIPRQISYEYSPEVEIEELVPVSNNATSNDDKVGRCFDLLKRAFDDQKTTIERVGFKMLINYKL